MRKPAEPAPPPQRAPAAASALPRRFYTSVGVTQLPPPAAPNAAHWGILLDDRPLRTPAKSRLCVPTRALADAIAAEWSAQNGYLDPATMPLTKLANSAIDAVRGREDDIRSDIVKYAASDLVCYRAGSPRELKHRQAQAWDPILAWAQAALGARFVVAAGVMPVPQTQAALANVALALQHCDYCVLAALHVLTTLLGSALLALAHARGHLSAEGAWAAAHVDEDWQIGQWGEDVQAAARRKRRLQELHAASHMLTLLGAPLASSPG